MGTKSIVGDDWAGGIDYDDAGNAKVIRYGNQLQQHVSRNAAFLTNRIWVDRNGGGDTLWDTGTYAYDWARNIKQIGDDYYRYDADGRLTWSRTTSSLYGTVDLDQQYDAMGNMTAQLASFPSGVSTTLPNGLEFSGRTYSESGVIKNRLQPSSQFSYDASGRLTFELGHQGLPTQVYEHAANGDLTSVSDGAGKWYQAASYEGDGHRWYRSVWAEGGTASITLRDASGQVVADFTETSAASGLKLEKEYVRVNGQLVAINSTCGPRPALALASPSVVSGQVWFDKVDYVPASGSYSIVIKTDFGETKTLYRPSNLANHFSIPLTEFFAGQTNAIQIETDAACGHTGYSNAVMFAHDESSAPGCLTSTGVSRSGFNGTGSNLTVIAEGSCEFGTTYNLHFQPWYDELGGVTLNEGAPEIQPLITLANIPCDSGEGYYWASPVIPGSGGQEGYPSLTVYAGPGLCGGGGGSGPSQPGQSSMNLQFVHWDHLGSTRLVTDELGAVIASSKFFPFGMEAETSGGAELRHKFTGHERDDRVGLDYMMARSCRMSLARFLEPDPYARSAHPASPQTWNRYAYVWNNPVNATDPSGYAGALVTALCGTNGSCDRPGVNGGSDPVSGPGRNGADNSRRQPDNAPTVPPKVRIAIAASIEASNSPSGEDKSGGFHEEGGYWGRDASGNLVVVPAQPGGNADPRTGDTKATVDVMKAVEPSQASKVATVEGTWHVHPKGETWVRGSKFKFEQGPSHDDINNATAPINVVVGARWKQVRFFNSTGQVGQAQSLNRFLEDK